MSSLLPGIRVRCINDRFDDLSNQPFTLGEVLTPKEGKEYIVREVVQALDGVGVRLHGLTNKKFHYPGDAGWQEPVFDASRFEIIQIQPRPDQHARGSST